MINKAVKHLDIGLRPYKEVWDLQEELFAEVISVKLKYRELPDIEKGETPNYLIFCQHPHVYTLGKSGKIENLLLDEKKPRKKAS